MKFKNIWIILLLIPVFNYAQTVDFNWLPGKWQVESAKGTMFEEWQMDGQRLKGEGYTVKDGQKKLNETLFLENFDGQWAYIALPKGQIITLFRLIQADNNSYIFENKEHDFPQLIYYNFDGQKTIHVTVEGNDKKFELSLVKVE